MACVSQISTDLNIKLFPKVLRRVVKSPLNIETKEAKQGILDMLKEIRKLERSTEEELGIEAHYMPALFSFNPLYYIFKPAKARQKIENHRKIAVFIKENLLKLKDAGYELPRDVAIDAAYYKLLKRKEKNIGGTSFGEKFDYLITINPFHFTNEFFYHEIGHYIHRISKPRLFIAKPLTKIELAIISKEFRTILSRNYDEQEYIEDALNYYTQDSLEFVAFYFQKAVKGYKFSKQVTQIYEKYGGPEIKGTIRPSAYLHLEG